MFVHALAGLSLVVLASVNPGVIAPDAAGMAVQMTKQEKRANVQPFVQSATDCVVHAVANDPRLGRMEMSELIVESFERCVEPVRALIDAHDRYYGAGTGEQFFMGPYLDALPATVSAAVRK
ncbi:MAG: hypothetical protein IT539_03160 [Bradyrhizobiaceae bacterium]|nr:hypothetical protein [Bradyrhizobiaceae bacterium]